MDTQLFTKIIYLRLKLKALILIGLFGNSLLLGMLPYLDTEYLGKESVFITSLCFFALFQAMVIPSVALILNGIKVEFTIDFAWMFVFQNVGHLLGYFLCLTYLETYDGDFQHLYYGGAVAFLLMGLFAIYSLQNVNYDFQQAPDDCCSDDGGKKSIKQFATIIFPKKKTSSQHLHSSSFDSIKENFSEKSPKLHLEISSSNNGLRRQNSAQALFSRHNTNKLSSNDGKNIIK